MRTSARNGILQMLLDEGQATKPELAAQLGFSESRIDVVLSELVAEHFATRSVHCRPRLFGLTRQGIEAANNMFGRLSRQKFTPLES